MKQIVEMDARQLSNLLRRDQPQTIALIASYLSAKKARSCL